MLLLPSLHTAVIMERRSIRARARLWSGGVIWCGGVVLLATLGLPLAWRFATLLAGLMRYPYPADGLEGTLLTQAHMLWSGQQLYQPFELYRFVSAPYPPWHSLILGFADQFAGPHAFWSGRMVSLIAGVLVLVVVASSVRIVAGSLLAGIVAAIYLFCTPPFILWATRIKPDMSALLWTALGLLLASFALGWAGNQPPHAPARRHLLATGCAALCFSLAFFTKQTALIGPLAAGLAFLVSELQVWRAMPRRHCALPQTLLFGLSYLALVGASWLVLDQWSHGQFTFHIWTQHRAAKWSSALMWKYVALLTDYWPLMLLGMGLLALALRDRRARVMAWYMLLVPLTLIGAGKTGANHNHLLETLLALALAAGVALGWALRTRRPTMLLVPITLVALQFGLEARPPAWYRTELVRTDSPERYLAFLRATPGEVLADDPSLLYLVGKPLRYDDPSGFGPVAATGLWNQRGLIDDIVQQRFSAIMIPTNVAHASSDASERWTPAMLAAIDQHYRVLFNDTLVIYVPKDE